MEPKPKTLRKRLVKQLVKDKVIRSQAIKRAFQKVSRHLFLPDVALEEVYGDFSIITKKIGAKPVSSSTQPSLMASMLEILMLQKGIKVLEIGTGTGYNAAILSEITQDPKKVFTIDIDPDTIKKARLNLTKAGYKEVTVKCSDGARGLPEHSPYDRLIVTCSIRDFPGPWIEQLKEGGIIVVPLWINGAQITPALIKQEGVLNGLSTTLGGFMELRSRTHQEILTGQPKLPKKLLICTEYPELFDEDKVISLLQKNHQEKALPSEGITPLRRYDFFVFVALYEKKSVELFPEGDTDEFGFRESAAGVLDLEKESACLISKDCKLLVYGNSYAYGRILSLAKGWDHLKKPGIDRLQAFVYPQGTIPTLMKNDILFKKKATQLVVRTLQP